MINISKQMNITSLIKFILLSLIFCIPQSPVEIEHNTSSFKSISLTNVYSFLIPSNSHFEHKVLKKIPLVESPILINFSYSILRTDVLNCLEVKDTPIETSYFISSSLARGPPSHS